MAKYPDVSLSVIRRLPRYYRSLELLDKKGVERISSREFAALIGVTASQVRQDLNCFGGFGQQGYGYNVKNLCSEISGILGLHKLKNTIVVGAGNLGFAIANYMSYEERGFKINAMFDNNKEKVGLVSGKITVLDSSTLESYCRENSTEIAVLCIPDVSAREVVKTLIAAGVKGFWNFSHYDIMLDYPKSGIVVENVNLGDSIMILSFMVEELND